MAEFRLANQTLVRLAQRDLADFWSSLDLSADPVVIRDLTERVLPDLVGVYGATAAVLGADWYDLLRDVPASARSFRALVANPVPAEQAAASARWALGPLFQPDPDPSAALSRLNGATQRLVLQPGRDSVWSSSERDPVETGVARVPSGATTCRFCTGLAARGAVYASLDSAGRANTYHDNCDCVPTVIRSRSDYPEGHDLDLFRRLYAEGEGISAE